MSLRDNLFCHGVTVMEGHIRHKTQIIGRVIHRHAIFNGSRNTIIAMLSIERK